MEVGGGDFGPLATAEWARGPSPLKSPPRYADQGRTLPTHLYLLYRIRHHRNPRISLTFPPENYAMPHPPRLIIIGGANGSGKTTLAKPYMAAIGLPFLNADELTKQLEEAGEAQALVKAGRLFFARLNDYLTEKQSFVVETTLSGSYINKVAQRARQEGYQVELLYLFLSDPQLCVERVAARVRKGGHDVPTDAIIRRYYRSKRNFWTNFRSLVDKWTLLYNGAEGFQPVAKGNPSTFATQNQQLLQLFKQAIG